MPANWATSAAPGTPLAVQYVLLLQAVPLDVVQVYVFAKVVPAKPQKKIKAASDAIERVFIGIAR